MPLENIVRRSRFATSILFAAALLALLASAPRTHAQGVPGLAKNKCLSGKTKCVSKALSGLLKCRELCQRSTAKCGAAQAECEARVMAKFDGGPAPEKGCFAKLEAKDDPAKPDSVCTTRNDASAVEAEVDAIAAELLARLEGTPAPTCGDGIVNAIGEACDGTDLNGATCASIGLPAGSLSCDSCQLDASGCVPLDCADMGGVEVGGACWFASAAGASCGDTCSAAGMVYDDATRTYAGSEGTNGACEQVWAALVGACPVVSEASCGQGFGCFLTNFGMDYVRCTSPATTSEAASIVGSIRACACSAAS